MTHHASRPVDRAARLAIRDAKHTVVRCVLQLEEPSEVVGKLAPVGHDGPEQIDGVRVLLTTRPLPEPVARGGIRRGHTCEDREGGGDPRETHGIVGVRIELLADHQVGHGEELVSAPEACVGIVSGAERRSGSGRHHL